MRCDHKTFLNHTNDGERYPDGKLVWHCSGCGLVGPWTESWRYYGNLECLKCQTADMEFVACSDKCWQELCAKHGVPSEPVKHRRGGGKQEVQRVTRKRRMTIRQKAEAYDQLVAEGKVQP